MKDWRVALAQIAPRLGDVDANLEVHLARTRSALEANADEIATLETRDNGKPFFESQRCQCLSLLDSFVAKRKLSRASPFAPTTRSDQF